MTLVSTLDLMDSNSLASNENLQQGTGVDVRVLACARLGAIWQVLAALCSTLSRGQKFTFTSSSATSRVSLDLCQASDETGPALNVSSSNKPYLASHLEIYRSKENRQRITPTNVREMLSTCCRLLGESSFHRPLR